jgi:hypothetical protein
MHLVCFCEVCIGSRCTCRLINSSSCATIVPRNNANVNIKLLRSIHLIKFPIVYHSLKICFAVQIFYIILGRHTWILIWGLGILHGVMRAAELNAASNGCAHSIRNNRTQLWERQWSKWNVYVDEIRPTQKLIWTKNCKGEKTVQSSGWAWEVQEVGRTWRPHKGAALRLPGIFFRSL